jgi:hypothetical protein
MDNPEKLATQGTQEYPEVESTLFTTVGVFARGFHLLSLGQMQICLFYLNASFNPVETNSFLLYSYYSKYTIKPRYLNL